jgi:hypothetical protein
VLFGYAGLRNLESFFTSKTTPSERAAEVIVGMLKTAAAIIFTAGLIALIETAIPD